MPVVFAIGKRNGCRRRSAPDSPGKKEKPKLEIDDNSERGFERLGRHAEGIREADGRIIDS